MFIPVIAFCTCFVTNLLAQDTLAIVTAKIIGPSINDEWVDGCFGCDCSLGCAVGWDVSVSSFLKPEGGNSYDVGNLEDFRAKTAWIEGKPDYGIGEYILYRFPKENWSPIERDSVNFDGFIIT